MTTQQQTKPRDGVYMCDCRDKHHIMLHDGKTSDQLQQNKQQQQQRQQATTTNATVSNATISKEITITAKTAITTEKKNR